MADRRHNNADTRQGRTKGSSSDKPAREGKHSLQSPDGDPATPLFVVGIGASAGGLDALKRFFAAVPSGTGISYVVVMHLAPSRKSMLDRILGRITPLCVRLAEDGMALEPDRVYVVPPHRELSLRGGVLQLNDPLSPEQSHNQIDLFFTSLAADQGSRAIALVLSGTGNDGSKGVVAVKRAGGAVFAQDEESAIYAGMPGSAIATGAVDLVLPVEEMPEQICTIAGASFAGLLSEREDGLDEQLAPIFHTLKTKTGNDFSSYKISTVLRRLQRRMTAHGLGNLGAYALLLENDPAEAPLLCRDLLIGVTSFFRDPEAFATLRTAVFPRLFADRNPAEPVRIWHASCSTGEEVYSMAMMLREYMAEQNITAPVQFFATDIDESAIVQARKGIYPPDIVSSLGRERLSSFFIRTGSGYQVAKSLREMIVFAPHSLVKDPPFSHLDLLVCRNCLIYLKPDMQQRIIALFHLALKPGRFLFLGSSETVGQSSDLFTPVDSGWKIYQRQEGEQRISFPPPFSLAQAGTTRVIRPLHKGGDDPSSATLMAKKLMESYAPPAVLVNDRYEVVHVSPNIGRFLEVPAGEPTRDLLRMARKELRPPLRSAIHKALAEQKQVFYRGVCLDDEKEKTMVDLVVEPFDSPSTARRLAIVIFEPVAEPPQAERGSVAIPGDTAAKDLMIRQLEEQLLVSHEQLQATIEQLETANEGLMSTNEELLSMNEEFQSTNEELHSTNEELETSREELQALNEELVTVNAELQEKVEELNQSNNDMDNLLTSAEIATLFLDREFRIKLFTPAMAAVFNLLPSDRDRPFLDLAGKVVWPELDQDMKGALTGQVAIEREVAAMKGGRNFLARVLPYRTAAGAIDGVVITLVDITQRKLAIEALRESEERYRGLFDHMLEGFAYCKMIMENGVPRDFVYLTVNEAFGKLTGLHDVMGKRVTEVIPGVREKDPELFDIYGRVAFSGRPERFERFVQALQMWFFISVYSPKQGYFVAIFDVITERKEAEEALRKSETRYRELVQNANSAIIRWKRDGTIAFFNEYAQSFFGYSADEALGRPVRMLLPERETGGAGLAELIAAIMEHPDRFATNVNENVCRDGRRVWMNWTNRPILDENGEVAGILAIGSDITGLKQAEQRLNLLAEIAGELLRTDSPQDLVDRLCHDVMAFLDCQAFFNFLVDEASGRLRLNACAGIPDEEKQNIEWLDFGTAVCGCAARDACRIVAENISRSADPRTDLVKSYGIQAYACHPLMVRGKVLGTLSFGTTTRTRFAEDDLSLMKAVADHVAIAMERKLARETLRQTAEQRGLALEAAELGAWDYDLETGEVFWDETCRTMFGFATGDHVPYAEAIARIHPDDRTATDEAVKQAIGGENGGAYHREFRVVWPDTSVHWLTSHGRVYLDPPAAGGKAARFIGVNMEITERKQAEGVREQAARLESLGLLAGGIAHDFNNILTAVVGNISLALNKIGGAHSAAPQLVACEKALEKATGLTRQLLTFSRGGEPIRGAVDTCHLLQEVASFGLHGSRCKAKLNLAPDLWWLNADAGQIHQALQNMIINALHAMPGGGLLTITAGNQRVDGSECTLPAGRYVKIEVADQGCGIPPEILPRIFDPYFTTKPAGTGLGLASVFSIVKRHGGAIDVTSTPGEGTTFSLLLPAADGKPSGAETLPDAGLSPPTPGTPILVMDDEEMIRVLAEAMLEKLGYRPVTCGDGTEAIDLYRRALEKGERFAAVILDMTVPAGMGGKEAASRILDLDPDALLVISTGYSVDTAYLGEDDPLFRGAVSKPYNMNRLAEEMARVLKRHSRGISAGPTR